MSDYNEGDLVEAVKGEAAIRGRVLVSPKRGLWLGGSGNLIFDLINAGFTITVIERATPQLPTVPGAYHDRDGGLWVLSSRGDWLDFVAFDGRIVKRIVNYHRPFTRLVPATK